MIDNWNHGAGSQHGNLPVYCFRILFGLYPFQGILRHDRGAVFFNNLREIGFFSQFSLGRVIQTFVGFNGSTNASPKRRKRRHGVATMKNGNVNLLLLCQDETRHESRHDDWESYYCLQA
jgi:hypothetical protein